MTVEAFLGAGRSADLFRVRLAGAGAVPELGPQAKNGLPPVAALRVLRSTERDMVSRFRDAGFVLSAVNHASLPRCLGQYTVADRPAQLLELVDGAPLDRLVSATSALALPAALQAAVEVGHALCALHLAKSDDGRPMRLIHRGVSASHVLLTENGRVVLTGHGSIRGTYRERQAHSATVELQDIVADGRDVGNPGDLRIDSFGLGAFLFELITRQPVPPFGLYVARHKAEVRAALRGAGLDLDLIELIGTMLDFDVDSRPLPAAALAALEARLPTSDAGALALEAWARRTVPPYLAREQQDAAPSVPILGHTLVDDGLGGLFNPALSPVAPLLDTSLPGIPRSVFPMAAPPPETSLRELLELPTMITSQRLVLPEVEVERPSRVSSGWAATLGCAALGFLVVGLLMGLILLLAIA